MTHTRIEEPVVVNEGRTRVRPRRRSVWPLFTLILVVLAGLLVVADRVAAAAASDRIKTHLVSSLQKRGVEPATTEVTVGGFPFLTQVAAGRYDEITMDMTDVRIAGVTLPSLLVVARGVEADAADLLDGSAKVTADQVTGTAVVDWSTVASLVDYARLGLTDVAFDVVGDALRVRGTANVAGLRVPMSATATLGVNAGVVRVRLRDARVEGSDLPAAAQAQVDSLAQRLSVDVPIPPLPFRLTIDDVRVQGPGLTVTATAHGVPLMA